MYFNNVRGSYSGNTLAFQANAESSILLPRSKDKMIVASITNLWDSVYDRYRKTVRRTLEDPVTHKQYIQTEQYLYDKHGQVPQSETGNNVDKKV